MPTLRWKGGTPEPVPGDAALYSGHDIPLKTRSLLIQEPEACCVRGSTLSAPRGIVRASKWPTGIFYNMAPAPQILYLEGGMGGPPDGIRSIYRGLAPSNLFPLVEKRKPWEE